MISNMEKSKIARNFDLASRTYNEVAVLQRVISERLIERLGFIRLKPERVLDIGSGTGMAVKQLKKMYRHCRIVLLDISAQMLRQAKKSQPWLSSGHHYLQADAEILPLSDNSIDLVFSNLTLQWCTQPDRVFNEVMRTLKPGGHLIFSTFGPSTLTELKQCWAQVDNYTHINSFVDMHDLGDAMTHCGLEDIVMEMEIFTMTYENGMGLMRDLQKLGARNINPGRQKGLTGKGKLNSVLTNYEAFRRDGRLPASFEVIYGHAWKAEKAKPQMTRGDTAYVSVDSLKRRA